jgi:ABC-type uncharacterized transport system substrate-binding protein
MLKPRLLLVFSGSPTNCERTDRGVEAIFIGGDNTVEIAMSVIVSLAIEGRIPVIACAPGHADEGALIGLGADYVEVGRAEGQFFKDPDCLIW